VGRVQVSAGEVLYQGGADQEAPDALQVKKKIATTHELISKELTNDQPVSAFDWYWKRVVQTAALAGFQVVRGGACLLRDPFGLKPRLIKKETGWV